MYFCCRFHSLPALCICVAAACGTSATSEKRHPWSFEVSCGFVHVCRFQGQPALCVCVAAACSASATSEENTTLAAWSMYLVDLVNFYRF